jgi:hypothetical protein
MQHIEFDKNKIQEEPHAARSFVEYMAKNSFGIVPRDWEGLTEPDIMNIALDAFMQLEREINVLEYLKHSKFELN